MLISKKAIYNANPPFLLTLATKSWVLVSKVSESNNCLTLEIVEIKNGNFNVRSIDLNELPFYVGEDIWELEYGSVIMTLNHPSLHDHPAKTLWEQWIGFIKKA